MVTPLSSYYYPPDIPEHWKTEYLFKSDCKTRAEPDAHHNQRIDLLICLQERFHADPNVYVAGNLNLYPHDGYDIMEWKPMIPDIFVVFDLEKKDRRYYDMQVEIKVPDVVIELASRPTEDEVVGGKWYAYAQLGVPEYFVFDPHKEIRPPYLRGFRLEKGEEEYVRMSGTDRLRSKLLGLDLVVEDGRLRLYDAKTGERLRTHRESEAEIVRLRKELARLQAIIQPPEGFG